MRQTRNISGKIRGNKTVDIRIRSNQRGSSGKISRITEAAQIGIGKNRKRMSASSRSN